MCHYGFERTGKKINLPWDVGMCVRMVVYREQREIQEPFPSTNPQQQRCAKLFFYIMQNKIQDFIFPTPPLQPPPGYLHQLQWGEEGRAQTHTIQGPSPGHRGSQKSNHHRAVL